MVSRWNRFSVIYLDGMIISKYIYISWNDFFTCLLFSKKINHESKFYSQIKFFIFLENWLRSKIIINLNMISI